MQNYAFDVTCSLESLYIHWPFCPYKCHFCPFVALASQDEHMPAYHAALLAEITTFAQQHPLNLPIKTIFLGGGTPSTYPEHLLLDMFATLNKVASLDASAEISIEVNPGTVSPSKLKTWKAAGINRLSIGVQSLQDTVLKKLNRHQSVADVVQLMDSASALFTNISVDLILGLPGVSVEQWKEMLERIVAWPITHISVYFLTVHEDTPLYFGVKKNTITLPPDEAMVELYLWTVDFLVRAGFGHYEISNFARPGFESRHNSVYWHRKPYKGFGLGACSFDGIHRFQNQKNLMNYCVAQGDQRRLTLFSEQLTPEQVHLERVMLGLRQSSGIDRAVLAERCVRPEALTAAIHELQEAGFVQVLDEHIRLTPAGLAVENEVVIKLTVV